MQVYTGERKYTERQLLELITEYGSLHFEQARKYLDVDKKVLKEKIRSLKKKGRVEYDPDEKIIMAQNLREPDSDLRKCFWLIVDLKDKIESHFKGVRPLYLMFYSSGKAYEVYYCKEGDELVMSHMIAHYREGDLVRTLVVIEKESQMKKFRIRNVTYCLINEEGDVMYYE